MKNIPTEPRPENDVQPDIQPDAKPEPTTINFREAKISIAVDVSGSTYGKVIEAERRAMRGIATLLPNDLQHNVDILPWSDVAEAPISVDDIEDLDPWGDTDPNVILQHNSSLRALQASSFWFLMTDGEIQEDDVKIFGRNLLKSGIHGKACVTCIFGETTQPPADCDITVGLSVFAISPHSAFLFTDVDSGVTYVLQTKGCFNALLPRKTRNPKLDYDTKWEDLPRTSYENLSRVSIAAPEEVAADEIILQDRTKLNLNELLKNQAPTEDTIALVLDNEDNLKSVTLSAKIQGRSADLVNWLDNVEGTSSVPGIEIAKEVLAAECQSVSEPDNEEGNLESSQLVADVRKRLSSALDDGVDLSTAERKAKRKQVLSVIPETISIPPPPNPSGHGRRRSSTGWARRVSDSSVQKASNNIGSFDEEAELPRYNQPRDAAEFPPYLPGPAVPGFQMIDDKRTHNGRCVYCEKDSTTISLLLKRPISEMVTKDFPLPNSNTRLLYPLTMGNYRETDVICSYTACDRCAFASLPKGGKTLGDDQASAVLPLVSFTGNSDAWLETINVGTQRRFDRSDLPLVFLAIIFTKLERLLAEDDQFANLQTRKALEWAAETLQTEVILQRPKTSQKDPFGAGAMQELLLKAFNDIKTGAVQSLLLEYPLDGFIVANAALSNSRFKSKFSKETRRSLVFIKFLYYVTEKYHLFSTSNHSVSIELAKRSILQIGESSTSRSLFKLQTLRESSVQFSSMAQLQEKVRFIRRNSSSVRLSVSISDLSDTFLLEDADLANFRRLGALFNWIESQASHAIALFLHYLLRQKYTADDNTPLTSHFQNLRQIPNIRRMLNDPRDLSPKKVAQMIRDLPML